MDSKGLTKRQLIEAIEKYPDDSLIVVAPGSIIVRYDTRCKPQSLDWNAELPHTAHVYSVATHDSTIILEL